MPALIRFYSCVRSFMPLTLCWWCKTLITIFALMRLLSCVHMFMLLAIWWIGKGLVTVLALIWFHSCVYRFVPLTIWRSYIALITIIALMRFSWAETFTSNITMSHFMLFTIRLTGKEPFTILALKRFFSCVWTFVLFDMRWITEALITVFALIRFFACVYTFMALAVEQGCKALITIVALVRFLTSAFQFVHLAMRWNIKELNWKLELISFHAFVHTLMPLVMWWQVKALVTNICEDKSYLLCTSDYVDDKFKTLQIRVSVDVSWNLINHYCTYQNTCTDNVSIPCVLFTNWWLGKASTLAQLIQPHSFVACALFCWINIVSFGLLLICPWFILVQWYSSVVFVLAFYKKRRKSTVNFKPRTKI